MGKIKLNENLKERRMGFFFMGIYIFIFLVYLFWDGWHYEWLVYGYDGANQHFDFNFFGEMKWDLVPVMVEGEEVMTRIIHSTNNYHNMIYICYYTATAGYLGLIFDNKWLKQGQMGLLAFPVISFISTINPYVAADVFNPDIFYYHSYFLQIVYDLNHISGTIMGVYLIYSAAKKKEAISYKHMTPTLLFTWFLFIVARFTLQKWPFWAPENSLGVISTNQINDMPFFLYGFEYLVVIALVYLINFCIKALNRRIKKPIWQALAPLAIFIAFSIILIAVGLIVLQEIPGTAFIQY